MSEHEQHTGNIQIHMGKKKQKRGNKERLEAETSGIRGTRTPT